MQKICIVVILSFIPVAFVTVALVLQIVSAQKNALSAANGTSTQTAATGTSDSSSVSSTLLPQQADLPPPQDWCTSWIFCPGQVLQTVSIANLSTDQKAFVDKPTTKNFQAVLGDFHNISLTRRYTSGDINSFLKNDFVKEGQEIKAAFTTPSDFNASPSFLNNISSPTAKAFAQVVHGFWPQLIRTTNPSALCTDPNKCESTFIPLNNPFVVNAGTFREQYYWDTFFIVEGLLQSQLFSVVKNILLNFMDQLDQFGFIPMGGRTYFLDRSNPPLFIQMLSLYVEASQDRSILARALPLAEKEMQWWNIQRSVQITSPNPPHNIYTMYRYNVANSAPRPESYFTDYQTVNDPTIKPPLNDSAKANLYADLAASSESGWGYSTRWFGALSVLQVTRQGLKNLTVASVIGPDLNSIIYKNHITLADLYGTLNATAAELHMGAAGTLRAAILDLLWDTGKFAFYDWLPKIGGRSTVFSAAAFYPFWCGIIPDQIAQNEIHAMAAFSSVNMVMNRYNGTFPATFINSGLEWDAPSAWPPHQYIILQALRNLPPNTTKSYTPPRIGNQSTFTLIPSGQLGLTETQLPGQPVDFDSSGNVINNGSAINATADVSFMDGTVVNGGFKNASDNWSHILQRELANRYFTSVLCSWHATGGSLPGNLLPKLNGITHNGNIFNKFSNLNVDSAGQEFTTQSGYGWTNGVLLWIAKNYGPILSPACPTPISVPGRLPQAGLGQSHVISSQLRRCLITF